MKRLTFDCVATTSVAKARAGVLKVGSHLVKTPTFMPVGTQATVKGLRPEDLKQSQAKILLANTYHLLLRPGPAVFEKMGGIQRMMNWSGAVLTDSGGYQIFSLPNARRISEHGAAFKSYVDGKEILLSPESSIATQKSIGSDIMMVLDQCVPAHVPYEKAREAMELTHRWAKRSLDARGDSSQALFGIIQGACYEDLRRKSAECIGEMDFDGYAIGGLAVGETKREREDFTEMVTELMPVDHPRYLMGVGTPIDLLEAVHRGVDMFDCIIPTAYAQQSFAFTSTGQLRLERQVYKFAESQVDDSCHCYCCANFSRAYIHHLFKAKESLGAQLLSIHNLHFYQNLMIKMRNHIIEGTYSQFYRQQKEILVQKDPEFPLSPPRAKKRKGSPDHAELGNFKLCRSKSGFLSIQQKSSSEIMHSVNNPDEEARKLYVDQIIPSKNAAAYQKKLVVWDIGLGAGFNAMALIQAFENKTLFGDVETLELMSFENDLDALKLACRYPHCFRHVRHSAPYKILDQGSWEGNGISWRLVLGDFFAHYERVELPDVIFYDPFSSVSDQEFWTFRWFCQFYSHLRTKPCQMITYSSSTLVRAQLLAAGFWVAEGSASGPKSSTTMAFTSPPGQSIRLLGDSFLQRWHRSDRQSPTVCTPFSNEQFLSRVASHQQFVPS